MTSPDVPVSTPRVPFGLSMLGWALNEEENIAAYIEEIEVPFLRRERGRGTGTKPRAIVDAIRDILTWWTRWILLGRRPDRKRGRIVPAVAQT